MVRGDIQYCAYIWAEIHDGLQLETGYLCHGNGILRHLQNPGGVWVADIAHHKGFLIFCFEDFPCQGRCCCLAVGACDGCQPSKGTLVRQLYLPEDWDLGIVHHSHKGAVKGYAGTDDAKLHPQKVGALYLPKHHADLCLFIKFRLNLFFL